MGRYKEIFVQHVFFVYFFYFIKIPVAVFPHIGMFCRLVEGTSY